MQYLIPFSIGVLFSFAALFAYSLVRTAAIAEANARHESSRENTSPPRGGHALYKHAAWRRNKGTCRCARHRR